MQVVWLFNMLLFRLVFIVNLTIKACVGCAYLNVTHSFVPILTRHFKFGVSFPMQVMNILRGQRQVIHQLDNLTNLLHEHLVLTRQANTASRNRVLDIDTVICPLIFLTVASIGYFMFKGLNRG
jgi:hypothetical protein